MSLVLSHRLALQWFIMPIFQPVFQENINSNLSLSVYKSKTPAMSCDYWINYTLQWRFNQSRLPSEWVCVPMMPLSLFCLLSEHQAALLQLKRECKEDLERMHVSYISKHWLKTYSIMHWRKLDQASLWGQASSSKMGHIILNRIKWTYGPYLWN